MKTDAVMCMALTSASPSLMPLSRRHVHLSGDVDETATRRNVEPEFFSVAFQGPVDLYIALLR